MIGLKRDQLHAAIESLIRLGRVRRDRPRQPEAGGFQAGVRDAVAMDQIIDNGLGAVLREHEVVRRAAVGVGVAFDTQSQVGILP